MGKALGLIIGIVETAVGIVTLNPALIVSGVLTTVGGVVTLLQKSPKPQLTEQALKSPIPPRVRQYGEGRLYGAYALFDTSANGVAVDVWAFCEGRIDAIIQYFVGDKRVRVVGSYVQALDDGTFGSDNDVVQVGSRLGLPTETAFSEVIAAVPDHWTTTHRGDGVVTGFMLSRAVKSKNYSKVYSTGGPNQTPLSLAMRGLCVFDWRDTAQSITDPSTWKWSANAVVHLADYLLNVMGKDWATHFAPTLAYWTAAANDADIAVPLKAIQTILSATTKSGHNSIALLSVNGLATGMSIAIAVSGDTSKTETRTVSGISGLTVSFSGDLSYDHPIGSQVTWTSSSGSPATEPRYRSSVAHQMTDADADVLAHLVACFDGWFTTRSDGAIVVYSGRYYAPTASIGPDEIIGYSLQEGVVEKSRVNTLKVNYISANHDYSVVDTDDWTDEADITSRGKVLSDSLQNQVPTHSQARRLAKRAMAKIDAPFRGTITTTAGGRDVIGQRYVNLDIIEAGTTFFSGPVEIQKVTRTLSTGGLSFDWIAANPDIDLWDPLTEEGNPAPVGNRVASEPLPLPVISSATPQYGYDSAAGSAGVYIVLSVTAPNRGDLTWFLRSRAAGATVWGERTYTDIAAGSSITLASEFVPVDASIEIEAAYQTGDGTPSDWSATTTVSTSSAGIAPAQPSGFTVTGGVGAATVAYDNPTSANFHATRIYHGSTSSFTAATQAGSDIVGLAGGHESHSVSESAGTRYFWVTSVSTGGAESTPVGPLSATIT